jgi:chromosome segregation ATPase
MIEKNISLTDSYLEKDVKTELSNKLAKIHNCEINKLSVIEVEIRNFIEQIAEAKKEKKVLESKIKERKNKILKIENNLQEIIEKKKHFSALRIHKKTEYEKFCTVCQNKIAEFKKEINLTSDKLDIELKSLDELALQINERLEQSEKIVQNNFFFSFLS